MTCQIKIGGKTYDLPKKDLSIGKDIERFGNLPELYGNGEVKLEEVVTEQHDFLIKCIGEDEAKSFLGSGNVEEIDIDELAFAVFDIIKAYTEESIKREMQNKTRNKVAEIKSFIDNKEVKKVVDIVSKKQ